MFKGRSYFSCSVYKLILPYTAIIAQVPKAKYIFYSIIQSLSFKCQLYIYIMYSLCDIFRYYTADPCLKATSSYNIHISGLKGCFIIQALAGKLEIWFDIHLNDKVQCCISSLYGVSLALESLKMIISTCKSHGSRWIRKANKMHQGWLQ